MEKEFFFLNCFNTDFDLMRYAIQEDIPRLDVPVDNPLIM